MKLNAIDNKIIIKFNKEKTGHYKSRKVIIFDKNRQTN
jgi:hypothetical protein